VGDVVPIGKIVETELRVVGRDVLRGARGEDWRDGPDEPLLVGPWMQYMATALNALKRSAREVLILHHLNGLTPEDLARLLDRPVGEIQARLGRAEGHLAQWLSTPAVRPALARFTAGLDRG
jgi:DNA-directed RNA polymerase specialized sigma24 family protein